MLPTAHAKDERKQSTRLVESSSKSSLLSIKAYLSHKSEPEPAIDIISESSEKSYDHPCTKQELLETICFLNYNLLWMFLAASASIMIYVLFTFELVFDSTLNHNVANLPLEVFLTVISSAVIVVDIAVIIIQSLFSNMTKKRDITPYYKVVIAVDLISLFTLFYLLIPKEIFALQIVVLVLCILRLYRIVRYFYVVSCTADLNNISTLLKKYVLLIAFILHTHACIWQYIGCYLCSNEPRSDWTDTLNITADILNGTTGTTWYTICLYYTSSLITTVGFGDIYGFTTGERGLSMAMMITGYAFMTATFLGGWTSVQMEHHRRHAHFNNRFHVLRRYLKQRRIPKYLGSKMCKFYLSYWYKRGAVSGSQLFCTLPMCLQQQVKVDIYWFFFEKSYYFRNFSDAFKRALSMVVTTEIKIDGEIIYEEGKERDAIVYIASGSVHLHSAEDYESTILTFGIGTLLGESCITCGTVSPVRVTAASFSVIYVLKKKEFWKIANQFEKLNYISEIHNLFDQKLKNAMHNQETREIIARHGETFKVLKLVRELLHTETPRADDGYFHVKLLNENERKYYHDLYILSRQEAVMKHSDEIFSRTVWPWSMHPQSPLLSIWEYTVVATVMYVAIVYPYRLVFGSFPQHVTVAGIIINLVYILDVIIQTLTSIETGNVILSEVPEIFMVRLRSFQYVLDIVAALPLVYITRILKMTNDKNIISLLSACRLLKIQRIFICMNKIGKDFKMNIPLARIAKYIVILCFVVYFMGSVFYLLACYKNVCRTNSWWQVLKDEDGETGVRSKYPFAVSMYFAMLVLSQAGFGEITAVNTMEMQAMMVFFAIGVLIFSYLVADFSATLMLTYRERSNFNETVYIIRQFLVSNNILPSIQSRINQYLCSQWMHDSGFSIMKKKHLLYDAPHHLLSSIKGAMYTSPLLSVPLFQGISVNILKEMAKVCNSIFLPPNEMVVYGGEIAREMFIIDKGVCLTVGRLFKGSSSVTYTEIAEEAQESWFVFPKKKLHPRNIDYEMGFRNSGILKVFKFVLLRRTILPYGNFVMFWEILRAICAVLTAMVFPLSVHLNLEIPNYMNYIKILDVLAVVDIYIRLHVGYYNKKGILVTHPKYTAMHYLSHAFIIDFIGVLPVQEVLHLFRTVHKEIDSSVTNFYKVQSFLAYIKLIQLYRLPSAFAYFERDPFKRKSIFMNIMLFVPISLVFINFLSSFIIIMTTHIKWDAKSEKFILSSEPNSWYYYFYTEKSEITVFELYLLAFYWTTTTCLTLGFGDITARQPAEMYFVIFSIIAGYLFFTYVLVVISSSIATINSLLATYQKHMGHIISYMKKEDISIEIQTRVIRHFEHVWQKTNGLTGNVIMEKCHMALRQDAVLSLYEQTLLEVPVFASLGKSFFRLCGIQLHEIYLLKDELIIKLNDIIDVIYIIHKGEVAIKAPDGSPFAILTRGCMFGNIDEVSSTRSMVSVVARTHTELLAIRTKQFYQIASEYSILKQRMKRHVLLENLSYIAKKTNIQADSIADIKGERHSKEEIHSRLRVVKEFFYGGSFELIEMLISFSSCIVVLYHMCFQDHSFAVLFITYALDVSHIIKIFLGFYKPFRNHLDEIIVDKVEIRKRYMAFSRFFVDLFAAIPFELFSLIADQPQRLFYLSLLRLNRCFRYYEIYQFFDVKFNRLNINVSAFKLGAILINFVLVLHVGACILYLVGCPFAKCNDYGWTYSDEGYSHCEENYYFCSLYFMTCIITWSGIGELYPRTIPEIAVIVSLVFCTKFISATFVGDISAVVQSHSHSLVNFDHGIVKLKEYLKNCDVCEPLRRRVLNYCKNLWKRQGGYQVPVFLIEAPKPLQEEIKIAAYGKHLYENYMFVNCHTDFLRLLIAKLEIQTFFASDMICQQGDINNKMYFIHKGTVKVLHMEENVEVLINELHEMDCFGIEQGLYLKHPHNFTFKAATVCVILSLDLKKWALLLQYFPSARYEIYEKVAVSL